jgi:hypothetical protein
MKSHAAFGHRNVSAADPGDFRSGDTLETGLNNRKEFMISRVYMLPNPAFNSFC